MSRAEDAALLLIDPNMLGTLYLGNVRLDAKPSSEFTKNLTTLRAEVSGLFHVRDANGAYVIDGGSETKNVRPATSPRPMGGVSAPAPEAWSCRPRSAAHRVLAGIPPVTGR